MGIIRAFALAVVTVATVATAAPGAHASAVVGSLTAPVGGTSVTVGKTVTVSAETDGACAPSVTVQAPAGDALIVASGNAGQLCGPVSFSGEFVPEKPGKHVFVLATAKGERLAEVSVTAANPPSTPPAAPTATVTVTETAEAVTPTPTPTVTTTTTVSPTATPTKTVTAKPKATPTVTRTVKVTSTPAVQPAPQALPQQAAPVAPVPTLEMPDSDVTQAPVAAAPQDRLDEMPAWLAYQLANQAKPVPEGPGFGMVVGAVFAVLGPLAAIGGLVGWLIYRRHQRAGRNPQ
ncbi:hypothetical protein ACGFJC_47070 [Nonomuraea fuscirosea]|uniref:hypothetical protein n=1 Tax=Nonomuraea fuscirosea TaxID=1291556 RepID=UPI0037166D78